MLLTWSSEFKKWWVWIWSFCSQIKIQAIEGYEIYDTRRNQKKCLILINIFCSNCSLKFFSSFKQLVREIISSKLQSFRAYYMQFKWTAPLLSLLQHVNMKPYCRVRHWKLNNFKKLELLIKLQKLSIYKGLMGCEQLLLVCWCIFKNDSICFVEATCKSPNKSKTVSFRNVSFSINSVVHRLPPIEKYSKFFLVVIWKEQ